MCVVYAFNLSPREVTKAAKKISWYELLLIIRIPVARERAGALAHTKDDGKFAELPSE
jgi:hypothetical protein